MSSKKRKAEKVINKSSKNDSEETLNFTDEADDQEEIPGEVKELPPLKPKFKPISAAAVNNGKIEYRRIRCPQHRLTPLRAQWENIVSPIVEYLKLQIRFNTKSRSVELKTSELTEDPGAAQKGQDFIEAFMMGFEIQDAVALLRLDDL